MGENNDSMASIMLVDDEAMILEVSGLMIESLGYKVETHISPSEALKAYTKNPANYDLLIIDMVMPNISGKDLFIKLKAVNPDVNAVISSGYQMSETDSDLLALGIKGFINKPYSIQSLATSLNEIIYNGN